MMDELKSLIEIKAKMYNHYVYQYSEKHHTIDIEMIEQYFNELNVIFATLKAIGYKISFCYKASDTELFDPIESVKVNGKIMFREGV